MKWKIAAFLALYLAVMMGVVFFGRTAAGNTHIQAGGIYGPEEGREEINGNLTVSASQVTLQNTSITGNLYLSPTGENGEIRLKNVDISGSLAVMGSVGQIILEDSGVKAFYVNAGDGHLQVQVEGDSHIGPTRLEAGANLKEVSLKDGAVGFTSVSIATARVSLSGSFETVGMESSSSQLSLLAGSVDLLEVTARELPAATLNLSSKTRVSSLLLNGPALIRGEGIIIEALINVHGATFQQAPEKIHLAPLVSALVAGEELVGEGAEEEEEDEDETEENQRTRPERPENFLASYDETLKRVTLRWQPGDEELTDRYLLTRQQGQGRESILSSVRIQTYHDTSISPGHTYTYYLVAVSPDGYFSHRVQARVSIPGQEPRLYTLKITIKPQNSGSVSGAGEYSEGTSVNLSATAANGFEFSHWEDKAGVHFDSKPAITILMDSTKEFTAFFMEIPVDPPANGDDDDPEPEPQD
jgi:hypothetical protein